MGSSCPAGEEQTEARHTRMEVPVQSVTMSGRKRLRFGLGLLGLVGVLAAGPGLPGVGAQGAGDGRRFGGALGQSFGGGFGGAVRHGVPESPHAAHAAPECTIKCDIHNTTQQAAICTPKLETNCSLLTVHSKAIEEREQCEDVVRTVCKITTAEIDNEVCTYSYHNQTESTIVRNVGVNFETVGNRNIDKVCRLAKTPHGLDNRQPLDTFTYQYQNIPSTTWSKFPKVTPVENSVFVVFPKPIKTCVNKPISLPRITCELVTVRKCFTVPEVVVFSQGFEVCTTSLGAPSCNTVELTLPTQVCRQVPFTHKESLCRTGTTVTLCTLRSVQANPKLSKLCGINPPTPPTPPTPVPTSQPPPKSGVHDATDATYEDDPLTDFNNFAKKFNKVYHSKEEMDRRKKLFERNIKNILEHNKKWKNRQTTYYMRVNKFADLDFAEFTSTYLGASRHESATEPVRRRGRSTIFQSANTPNVQSPAQNIPSQPFVTIPSQPLVQNPYNLQLQTPYNLQLQNPYNLQLKTPYNFPLQTSNNPQLQFPYNPQIQTPYNPPVQTSNNNYKPNPAAHPCTPPPPVFPAPDTKPVGPKDYERIPYTPLLDYNEDGGMGKVREQNCNSCTSHVAVSMMENCIWRKKKEQILLSEDDFGLPFPDPPELSTEQMNTCTDRTVLEEGPFKR